MPHAPSAPWAPRSGQPKIIARASTLKLIDKLDTTTAPPENESQSIPKGSHWVDETEEGTVLVIEQPTHHTCAAVGGIMAIRMKVRGLQGCVVGGRVRDMTELEKSGLPVSIPYTMCPFSGVKSNHVCSFSVLVSQPLHLFL